MKNNLATYLNKIMRERKLHRRTLSVLALVAVFVGVTVLWQLHITGIAVTGEALCGMPEHVHTDACLQTEMVCGLQETDGHTHTDDCYTIESILACEEEHDHTNDCFMEVRTLVCGQEECEPHHHTDDCYLTYYLCGYEQEHVHTEACYADEGAEDNWQASIPAELSGNWAADTLAIARSQIGYEESKINYTEDEDGTRHGYTRYGAFYGTPYAPWDAAFVNFCLTNAGVDAAVLPQDMVLENWKQTLSQAGLLAAADNVPQAGDIVFVDDRAGIVSAVGEGTINVIQRDDSGFVSELGYITSDESISGYVSVGTLQPAQAETTETAEPTENAEQAEETTEPTEPTEQAVETAEPTEETSEEETKPETVKNNSKTVKGDDFTITAYYDDEAGIPANAVLKATKYDKDSEEYKAHEEQAGTKFDYLFDIGFYIGIGESEKEIEPLTPVTVTIQFRGDDKPYSVTHFADDGIEMLEVDSKYNEQTAEAAVTYETDSFSPFGFSKLATTFGISGASTTSITGENTVAVGESITLTSTSGKSNHSWSSNKENVATVVGNGKSATVTGKSTGTVTITHHWGLWNSETYTVTVTGGSSGGTTTTGKPITFQYYPQSEVTNNGDALKAPKDTVKFTVNLLDKDGNLTTTPVPDNAVIPTRYTTVDSEMNISELIQQISIDGYTIDDGYAFFFWGGNQAITDKMDLAGVGAHKVTTFKNFTRVSDVYGDGSSRLGTTTNNNAYHTIGYTMTELNGSSMTGRDWTNDTKGYYAYEYGGVLHVVLKPVSETVKFKTRFYNYAESAEKVVDTTECHDMAYSNQQWQGKLTMTTKYPDGEGLTSPGDSYRFVGWYDSCDENGNGTGTKIEGNEVQYSDKTVYAKWEPIVAPSTGNPFITVSKTFEGLTQAEISQLTDFRIMVKNSNGVPVGTFRTTTPTYSKTGSDEEKNWTYVWKLENCQAGTYTVTESGEDSDELKYTCTETTIQSGDNTASDGTITVDEGRLTATIANIYTPNSVTEFSLDEGQIFIGVLTGSVQQIGQSGEIKVIVWTPKPLSHTEQAAIEKAGRATGNNEFGVDGEWAFYSGTQEIRLGSYTFTTDATNKKVEFSDKGMWKKAGTADYTISDTVNGDISITNTYEKEEQYTTEPINFYINLASKVLDTNGNVAGRDVDLFTKSVSGKLSGLNSDLRFQIPAGHIHAERYNPKDTDVYEIIVGKDGDRYAKEVDTTIREELPRGYNYTGGTGAGEINNGMYKLVNADGSAATFPEDEDIFQYIRNNWNNGDCVNKWQPLTVNGVAVDKDLLTKENFEIRWYVCKDEPGKGDDDWWHIDGILVAKTATLTVTKTFTVEGQSAEQVKEIVEAPYTSAPTDNQETTKVNEAAEYFDEHCFYLTADGEKTVGDQTFNAGNYKLALRNLTGVTDGKIPHAIAPTSSTQNNDGSVTYTWELSVLPATFTLGEDADIDGYIHKDATYSVDSLDNTQDKPAGTKYDPATGAVITTQNVAADAQDKTQRADFTNNYEAGETLPNTGGIGTTLFRILGGCLLVVAAVSWCIKRRQLHG